MSGYLYTTPFGRAAAAKWVPGGVAALAPRVPAGHTVSLSARSAHGPWQVSVNRKGTEVFYRLSATGEGFREAVEEALRTVWP